jgi:hypothetical protein
MCSASAGFYERRFLQLRRERPRVLSGDGEPPYRWIEISTRRFSDRP